jgi:signal transduction histidine kinase
MSGVKKFLNNTLSEIMCLVGAECGSLFLFDFEHKELVLDSFQNSSHIAVNGLRRKIGEGVSGKVLELKTPVLVRNIDDDLRFKRNGFNHYHTNSFISIPLIANNVPIGLINIADKASGEPFLERDFEFAVTIAKYACMSVEHLMRPIDKQDSALEKYATVGKLAAGVVHEVNNPLDGVIRYANILLAQMDNNSAAREYILEMKKGLNRIANTTKTLLHFSHQVNSHHPKKYVDLHEIIDESLGLLKEKTNGSIRINKQYKDGLPKVLDLGISHVVINIIKNALDAMSDVGMLDIATDIKGAMLELTFKDSGYGIPNEIMDHIFEPFFTTKSKENGTGLGLAICKEIINKYEGSIEVQSFSGKGSNFTVLIPVKYLENA